MFEALFGNETIERILFFLLANERSYATEMRRYLGKGLYPIQRALDRLESGGIVDAQVVGRTRVYRLSPRYPFIQELRSLLEHAYEQIPEKQRREMYEPVIRRRPRKRGKPL